MRKKVFLLFVSLFSLIAVAQDTEFWFAPPTDTNLQQYKSNAGFIFSNTANSPANVDIYFF